MSMWNYKGTNCILTHSRLSLTRLHTLKIEVKYIWYANFTPLVSNQCNGNLPCCFYMSMSTPETSIKFLPWRAFSYPTWTHHISLDIASYGNGKRESINCIIIIMHWFGRKPICCKSHKFFLISVWRLRRSCVSSEADKRNVQSHCWHYSLKWLAPREKPRWCARSKSIGS